MNAYEMPSGSMDTPESPSEMPSGSMDTPESPSEMPSGSMDTPESPSEMPSGSMDTPESPADMPSDTTRDHSENVLVELRVTEGERTLTASAFSLPGMVIDSDFEPIPMQQQDNSLPDAESLSHGEQTVIVRATIDPSRRAEIEADPNVVKVWMDGQIAPFQEVVEESVKLLLEAPELGENQLALVPGMATCPIGTCDCSPNTAKGGMGEVANYLGVDQIWATGKKGDGMVVGVVDGGIRAAGRPIRQGESGRTLGRVIGGWPTADWGTTAAAWSDHGMMCGTDVLGMAPGAQLYDLRISDGSAVSSALQAFEWAIKQHRIDGTPHILTNSWGMFQKAWDPDYTTNPNHPFTRKVLEAIDEGILVLFAAGNCGGTCPDGRCGSDVGPGKSIWGANGHARVITVGAVNKNEQFVGYSSQGPAALSSDKPDFCSVTHFTGYFNSDSGTSAATPIAAGVVALLKQSKPSVTQQEIQSVLKSTAKDIGATGFDQNAGAGILRAKAAYDAVAVPPSWKGWESLGGFCTDGVGVSSWAPGRLDCFVVGNDRALWHKWYSNGWSNWESLGGKLYSNPAAVSWGPNRIDAFAIGGDHAMWHRWWDGSSWKGWESLGGFCTDGVGVSSWAPGRLDCFVVGNDRALWHKWYSNGWSNWESLGGKLYSNPAAVSWGPNRIDAFAIGGDHAMWHRWWDGSSWKGWESLGGFCTDGVGVSSWAPGRLDCFVVGNDRALWHKWYSNGWSDWESLGGKLYSNPAAVSWGPNRIDAFAIGGDHAMWHRWWV